MKPKKQTIFALSTPYAQSAVAVIRISGDSCLKVASRLLKKKKLSHARAHFRKIYDLKKTLIDEGIIIYFKSPKSFTGEDCMEIHTHGSLAVINKLLDEIGKIEDCRFAEPGEFSKRAFLNNKRSLFHYEGISNLIAAETEAERSISTRVSFGETENICQKWRRNLVDILSLLDASIDFPEEGETFNLKAIGFQIKKIIDEAKKSLSVSENIKNFSDREGIVLFGPPNTGKSSIFNLLCQEERAITSAVKGTTTDKNIHNLDLFGVKISITDTAGIRNSKNIVEKIGVRKTIKTLKESKNLILVLSPDSLNKKNLESIRSFQEVLSGKNLVIIFNKSDLDNFEEKKIKWKSEFPFIEKIPKISISCKDKSKNLNMLTSLIKFIDSNLILFDRKLNQDYYFPEKRHTEIISSMILDLENFLVNFDDIEIAHENINLAIKKLDELYGKNDIEDRLGNIFSNFCIGK